MTFVLFGPTLAPRAHILATDELILGDKAADASGAAAVRVLASNVVYKNSAGNYIVTSGNLNLANSTSIQFKNSGGTDLAMINFNSSNNLLFGPSGAFTGSYIWYSGGAELMRLTPIGNLSIGGTAATARLNIRGGALAGDPGINMTGELTAGRVVTGGGAGSTHAIHGASDSTALELSQGSTSGYVSAISIGARSFAGSFGDSVQFITRSTVKLYIEGTAGHVVFGTDNLQDLGSASRRGKVAYFGTGTINTSDEREKTDIGDIPDAWLDAWADVQWQRFKFVGGNRWHVGLVAQSVHAAFAAHDLDAFDIGLCCFDAWEEQREPILETVTKSRKATRSEQIAAGENDEGEPLFTLQQVEFDEEYEETVDTGETRVTLEAGDRWGLRYDECQAIEAAWQRRELSRMSARLAALEGA